MRVYDTERKKKIGHVCVCGSAISLSNQQPTTSGKFPGLWITAAVMHFFFFFF